MYKATLYHKSRHGRYYVLSQARTLTQRGALLFLSLMRWLSPYYEYAQGKVEKDGDTLYLI